MIKHIQLIYGVLLTFIVFGCNSNSNQNISTEKNKIVFGSANPYATIDKSPLDISYYPPDFPTQKMNGTDSANDLVARVIYSRPQKNGRIIFADSLSKENFIQPYGKEWRLGANEATEIEFFKPVIIQGNKIAVGRYIIYCIPYPDKWIIKLNTNLFSWGLHMNTKKDIASITVPVSYTHTSIEYFTMVFQKSANQPKTFNLLMAWDNIIAELPITLNE